MYLNCLFGIQLGRNKSIKGKNVVRYSLSQRSGFHKLFENPCNLSWMLGFRAQGELFHEHFFVHGFLAICYVARIIFSDSFLRAKKKRTCFFFALHFPSHSFANIWYPVYLFIKVLKMETAKGSSSFAQEWNLTFGKIAQKKRVSSWNLTDYVIFCQVECDNIAVENGFHPQDVIYTWFTTIWMTESGRLKRHLAPTAT